MWGLHDRGIYRKAANSRSVPLLQGTTGSGLVIRFSSINLFDTTVRECLFLLHRVLAM